VRHVASYGHYVPGGYGYYDFGPCHSHIITTFASLVTHDNATNKLTSIRRIVGGGAVIDATAEPVRGIGPGGRKPD
jgi:hypothetical protein